jgi:hypothetical protein
MASTYVNDLRLNEMATGDGAGTWGTTTNTNLELIGEALGYGTEGITTNADTHATTVADGATDPGRAMYIKYTGTLDSACTITIGPNTLSRVHIIENATSGSQNIIIKQGSGAEVTIANGFVKAVYLDGAGSGAAVTEAFTDLSVGGNLLIDGATPTLTIGDAGAEDTKIVFDGNAQDFYIGLDDSADDLVFGKGSALGTTQAMAIDENMDVAFGPTTNVTITNDGNEDTLTLVSTDADASAGPNLRMYRNSSSPADADVLGVLDYEGRNDNSQDVVYASITAQANDVSDGTEDGSYYLSTMVGGTLRNRMNVLHTETVFNQEAIALDFRIESDNKTHVFFVDGTNDHVNIGASTDRGGLLNIETSDNSVNLALVSTDADANVGPVLELYRNSSSPADNDELARIYFYGENDNDEKIEYGLIRATIVDASDGDEGSLMQFLTYTGGGQKSRIELLEGETVFNEGSSDIDFRVEGNGDTHALFVNAGSDVVSFGGMQSDSRYFSGLIPKLQADALTRMDASIGLTCNSNDTLSPMIMFGKTRGAALNGTTVAAAGDAIGSIVFNPSDGTANLNAMGHTAAAIDAAVGTGIGTNDVPGILRFYTNPGGESSSERMRIEADGDVVIGTTSGDAKLTVYGESSGGFNSRFTSGTNYQDFTLFFDAANGNGTANFRPVTLPGSGAANMAFRFRTNSSGSASTNANVVIDGSLGKGSGSFLIDHPLESMTETHHLYHSFIEGPQADLIYRGKVELVTDDNGKVIPERIKPENYNDGQALEEA